MPAMIRPLQRYADFRGRSRRVEFWGFVVLLFVAFLVAVWLDGVLGTGGRSVTVVDTGPGFWSHAIEQTGGWITAAVGIAVIVPLLAVTVRRMHDAGWSGLWLLAAFVPLIGGLFLLVLLLSDSRRGANRFGPDPKQPPVAAPAALG